MPSSLFWNPIAQPIFNSGASIIPPYGIVAVVGVDPLADGTAVVSVRQPWVTSELRFGWNLHSPLAPEQFGAASFHWPGRVAISLPDDFGPVTANQPFGPLGGRDELFPGNTGFRSLGPIIDENGDESRNYAVVVPERFYEYAIHAASGVPGVGAWSNLTLPSATPSSIKLDGIHLVSVTCFLIHDDPVNNAPGSAEIEVRVNGIHDSIPGSRKRIRADVEQSTAKTFYHSLHHQLARGDELSFWAMKNVGGDPILIKADVSTEYLYA